MRTPTYQDYLRWCAEQMNGPQSPQNNMNIQGNSRQNGQGNFSQQWEMFKIVPVGSIDEARAIPTSFEGYTFVMPDLANRHIYLKRLNYETGLSDFVIYTEAPALPESPAAELPGYDVKEEIDSLRSEIEYLKKELGISEVKENV